MSIFTSTMWDPWFLGCGLLVLVWTRRAWLSLESLRYLKEVRPVPQPPPECQDVFLSVIIPAKNEERNIAACLDSLLCQDWPHYEIIVINDNSTDGTESILKSKGAQEIHPSRSQNTAAGPSKMPESKLYYVNAPPVPPGWTGKNFAITRAASLARGEWLVFTDADTRHEPSSLSSAFRHAAAGNTALLSLLPRCLAGSFFEHLIQPFAMGLLGLWFPFKKVNNPASPVYFANGQYLLIRRDCYEQLGGHAGVRQEYLEDFALMRKAKTGGFKTECALGTAVYGTRMYDSLTAIWRGWRRIYLHAFRKNAARLFLKGLNVFLTTAVPFLAPALFLFQSPAETPRPLTLGMMSGVLALILVTAGKTYEIVRARRRYAILAGCAGFLASLILWHAAWKALAGKPTRWR